MRDRSVRWSLRDRTRALGGALVLCGSAALACAHTDPAAPSVAEGAVAFEMVRHPRSGALMPRLTRYRDPAALELVNRDLDALAASLACEEDVDPSELAGGPAHFETTARVTYAAADVLSVAIHSSFFCGGAYPTGDANDSVTYDLATGTTVRFADLFSDFKRDGADIVRALYPEKVARAEQLGKTGDEGGEDDCDDAFVFSVGNLLGSGFSYALSRDGLVVQPDFPHALEACAEEVTVPFERVRRFAAPGGVLDRVAGAASAAGPGGGA